MLSAPSAGGGSPVKSIQRGTITISNSALTNTATITSVNTAKTELRYLGASGAIPTDQADQFIRLELTNATTVTAARGDNHTAWTVSFELTEFY